jgi:hypothetical protein
VEAFSPTAAELSAGTELALLNSLLSVWGYFHYFVDGIEVTSFEPLSRETATGPLLTVRPGCGGG